MLHARTAGCADVQDWPTRHHDYARDAPNLGAARQENPRMARVLVVEGDPAIRRLLALHLESETHDVFTAEDGE